VEEKPDNAKIRELEDIDIPRVVLLWQEYMDFHSRLDPYLTRSDTGHEHFENFLRDQLDSEDKRVLVAEIGNEIAGYCFVQVQAKPPVFESRTYGLIMDLAVTSSWRKRGIGTALFKGALDWLHSRGVDAVELQVSNRNQIATSFWRRHGFEPYLERLRLET
jgi:ribosomal protein S18 acetylase RimI-like enzyme